MIILLLMPRNKKSHPWSSQQVTILTELHPQFPSKRWKHLAQQLTARGYPRTENQCREKWVNFLSPDARPRDWEEWELAKLYDLHAKVGSRWCLVQQAIGRTQNNIKNRFYGTIRNFIRAILDHHHPSRCFNEQISRLSPNYLNSLYSGLQDFTFMEEEVREAITAMRYKVDRSLLLHRMEERNELYRNLVQKLLEYFQERFQIPQPQQKELQQQQGEDEERERRSQPQIDNMVYPTYHSFYGMGMLPIYDLATGRIFWLQ